MRKQKIIEREKIIKVRNKEEKNATRDKNVKP